MFSHPTFQLLSVLFTIANTMIINSKSNQSLFASRFASRLQVVRKSFSSRSQAVIFRRHFIIFFAKILKKFLPKKNYKVALLKKCGLTTVCE